MNDDMPQVIEPNYKLLYQFLLGWIAGKGMDKELKETMRVLGITIGPIYLVPKDSNIKMEDVV